MDRFPARSSRQAKITVPTETEFMHLIEEITAFETQLKQPSGLMIKVMPIQSKPTPVKLVEKLQTPIKAQETT
jgi:pseudouridine-5'-phosphate glycosidase